MLHQKYLAIQSSVTFELLFWLDSAGKTHAVNGSHTSHDTTREERRGKQRKAIVIERGFTSGVKCDWRRETVNHKTGKIPLTSAKRKEFGFYCWRPNTGEGIWNYWYHRPSVPNQHYWSLHLCHPPTGDSIMFDEQWPYLKWLKCKSSF